MEFGSCFYLFCSIRVCVSMEGIYPLSVAFVGCEGMACVIACIIYGREGEGEVEVDAVGRWLYGEVRGR